ncbi:hypothetical protein B0H14DRAFT_2560608 [Mycena olivaceomarginata]|nr:hypothetical protein B0H14DRAFT_2560608 [Mycena olivaceomarginata]
MPMDELAAPLAHIPEAVLSLYKEKWDSLPGPSAHPSRCSARKRRASSAHVDTPPLNTQTADARTEPPVVEKSRKKRKVKPLSVQHADGLTYTSFEFCSLFPAKYLELYGDAEPA